MKISLRRLAVAVMSFYSLSVYAWDGPSSFTDFGSAPNLCPARAPSASEVDALQGALARESFHDLLRSSFELECTVPDLKIRTYCVNHRFQQTEDCVSKANGDITLRTRGKKRWNQDEIQFTETEVVFPRRGFVGRSFSGGYSEVDWAGAFNFCPWVTAHSDQQAELLALRPAELRVLDFLAKRSFVCSGPILQIKPSCGSFGFDLESTCVRPIGNAGDGRLLRVTFSGSWKQAESAPRLERVSLERR